MRFIHLKCLMVFAALALAALCKAADDPARANPHAGTKPRVALLLPLDSPDFAAPADAVVRGCRAAFSVTDDGPAIEVRRTDASIARIAAQYDAAADQGAAVVIGPMTRDGVSALAEGGRISVPTLALNAPENAAAIPHNLYVFGLSIESEARQAARVAFADGLRSAALVRAASPLARRTVKAFADTWFALGGNVSDVLDFDVGTDLRDLRERMSRSRADMVFLAVDATQAQAVRPYLNSQIPVYATSRINIGQSDPLRNLDLNGVRFVEMPWLAQPDNMTAMVFPRPESLPDELQRFYALGIDACRIANQLIERRASLSIEGVTGSLHLKDDGFIEREGVQSVIQDGTGVAIEAR